jgi:hypothetical protein
MTGDGATTDFGEEERLRRAIDRTPRRPTITQPVILSRLIILPPLDVFRM